MHNTSEVQNSAMASEIRRPLDTEAPPPSLQEGVRGKHPAPSHTSILHEDTGTAVHSSSLDGGAQEAGHPDAVPTTFTSPASASTSFGATPVANPAPFSPSPGLEWTQDQVNSSSMYQTPPGSAHAHATGNGASEQNLLQKRQQQTDDPPSEARRAKARSSFAIGESFAQKNKKWFRSRRVKRDAQQAVKQPRKMNTKDKCHMLIPLIGLVLGAVLAGLLVWDGVRSVTNYKYCSVLDDDFSQGLRSDVWTREVQVGGFGNGQFEETTASDENSFVKNGILYIKPTLQDASLVETDGTVLDLRSTGCTGTHWWDCVASTNVTNGTVVNPVRSARLTTRLNASIKFGRIEVEAKLPEGDWLWPAIWMLPRDNVYGEWPRSGELDIAESRGNNYTYHQGGNNIVSSTLHYGPDEDNDGWWRNNVKRKAPHTTWSSGWNTFGVEWTPTYIFTYVNSRLIQTLYHPLNAPLWQPSQFPYTMRNGTRLTNPWAASQNPDQAPFDHPFYLILSLGVGGTNGWFEDGRSGKPWVDRSDAAKRDFWGARGEWGRSWGLGEGESEGREEKGDGKGVARGVMMVRRVRMWQQVGFEGCEEEKAVHVY